MSDIEASFLLREEIPNTGDGRWGPWYTYGRGATFREGEEPQQACSALLSFISNNRYLLKDRSGVQLIGQTMRTYQYPVIASLTFRRPFQIHEYGHKENLVLDGG